MSAVPADFRIATPWRHALVALSGLIAVILFAYRETAIAMVGIWSRSDTFAHAFLVPPIALWLIWRQRERLAALTPRPQPLVLLAMAAVAVLWLLGELVSVNAATQFALVGMLVLAVPAVLGFEVAYAILFPLLFLFFSVPFGEFLMPALMESTADFTVFALQASGIPVFREGRQFIIPSGSWSVVEACSGVRYLIASCMVGSLFAYLSYRSAWRRLAFMGVAIGVPIVANWLRAYMIVMLGHLSGNTIAVGVDHIIYGWVFFGIVIMTMYLIGMRWSQAELPFVAGPRAVADTPAAPRAVLATVLAGLLIVLFPYGALWGLQRAEGGARTPQLALPERLAGGWSAGAAGLVAWEPKFVNPSASASRAYAGPGGSVGVYVAYFRHQGPERKLVSGENVLVHSQDRAWNQVATGRHAVQSGAIALNVQTAEVLGAAQGGDTRRAHLTAWRLYWVDGRFIADDARAKLAGALARLRGHGDDGAAVVLYTDNDSNAAAAAALEGFTQANLATLDALLRQTRETR